MYGLPTSVCIIIIYTGRWGYIMIYFGKAAVCVCRNIVGWQLHDNNAILLYILDFFRCLCNDYIFTGVTQLTHIRKRNA